MKLSELNIGDKVDILLQPGFTAGGDESYGVEITNITTQYDEKTGDPYKVIWIGERGFEAIKGKNEGYPINPPLAYYIVPSN